MHASMEFTNRVIQVVDYFGQGGGGGGGMHQALPSKGCTALARRCVYSYFFYSRVAEKSIALHSKINARLRIAMIK